jgi:hypothetical protein
MQDSMSALTEKLISIFERERRGSSPDPDAEKPNLSIPMPPVEYYSVGTIFRRNAALCRTAILARIDSTHCMLISLPEGNRYSDNDTFQMLIAEPGVRKEVFHQAYNEWEVSQRGKEALADWARSGV